MVEIKIVSDTITPALDALAAKFADLTPLMKNIAGIMEAGVEENFAKEGQPAWNALSPVTLKRRAKEGHTGKIMQVTGKLASSITSAHDATSAQVGTNDIRAKTLHFGAKKGAFGSYSMLQKKTAATGKKSQHAIFKKSPVISLPWGDIPARPFVMLAPDALGDIEHAVLEYAKSAL